MAEYEALILGLKIATEMDISQLEVFGDSKLVVNQLQGEYEIRKPELLPYHGYATQRLQSIDKVSIAHVPGTMNKQVDGLTGLASSLSFPGKKINIPVCERWVAPHIFEARDYEEEDEEEVMTVTLANGSPEDWRKPFIDYFLRGKHPDNPKKKAEIKRRALRYVHFNDMIFRRSFGEHHPS